MIIGVRYKIEKCVSHDELRPSLMQAHVKIEGKAATVQATNGVALVVVPADPSPEDVSGPVSTEALQRARKLAFDDGGEPLDTGIALLSDEWEKFMDGAMLPRVKHDDTLFPETEGLITRERAKAVHHRIGINVKQLKNISDALGTESVMLLMPKDNKKPIVVTPLDYESKAYGVMAPIAVESGEPSL